MERSQPDPTHVFDSIVGEVDDRDRMDSLLSSADDRSPFYLPASFFDARPELAQIALAAQARLTAPDAVFAKTLGRISAIVPPSTRLPALVGGAGTLDIAVAVIGNPGVGKSSSTGPSRDLVPIIDDEVLTDVPIGSGEGLIDAYFAEVDEIDPNTGKTIKVKRQTKRSVLVNIDEGSTLTELGANRRGSTLFDVMRSMWSGETVGMTNASIERRRRLDAGTYRLVVCAGFQPSTTKAILDQLHTGTPQRFLWLRADAPNAPDVEPAWPGALRFKRPSVYTAGSEIGLDPIIATEIRNRRRLTLRGEVTVDPLAEHDTLQRLKVAALLAVLASRDTVNLDDWALAKTVTDVSRANRTWLTDLHNADQRHAEEAANNRHVRRELAVVDSVQQRALDRMTAAIARHVHRATCEGGTCNRRCAARSTAGRDRTIAAVDDAIDAAVNLRWITVDEDVVKPGSARPT